MNKKCTKCGELRCRGHCKCAREGEVRGRAASRGTPGRSASLPGSTRLPARPAVAPHGADRVQVQEGIASAVQELSAVVAKKITVATYVYDDSKLHKQLLCQLASPGAAAVEVLVDAAQLGSSKNAYKMKAMLQQLQRANAVIRLCRGRRSGGCCGAYHHKAMVIDGRLAFVGSANLTFASRINGETVLRLSGPCVKDVLANIVQGRRGSTLLGA
jgi:phosphatidylserine/phosphatidylglycerophosphate/cardiolipin synthase-like enzyme